MRHLRLGVPPSLPVGLGLSFKLSTDSAKEVETISMKALTTPQTLQGQAPAPEPSIGSVTLRASGVVGPFVARAGLHAGCKWFGNHHTTINPM